MADSILTNYTESGPIVANGTVGTTPTEIIIRSPAEQRVALDVYSTEQVNSIFLPLSGGSLFGDLNMDNYSIHGVHAPTAASDAANKQYVDVTALAVSGGNTMAAPINMGGNRVVSMADPVAAGDAATRRYVDTSMLALSGLNSMTGPLKMGGNVISSVGTPVFAGDAANKLYVDNTAVALTGDTMNGVLNMNYNPITLVGTPVSAGDATNKYYVDSAVALGVASVSNGVGYLPLTGTSAMVGAFDMGTHAIRNVVTSSSSPATDAANKQYVDTSVATCMPLAGGSLSGTMACTGAGKITGVPAPVTGPDAANKTYVDNQDALKLSLSGGTMSGALNMGGNKVSVTYTPSTGSDVTNKTYVDTQDALKLSLTGGTMSGALNMGGNKVSVTYTPSTGSDVTNKTYVDTQDTLKLSLTGGTMSGALNMGVRNITNLATPSDATDAATKAYVDTTAASYVPLTNGTLTNAALAGSGGTITGTLSCSGAGKITGVPTPSAASDAVPKSYADLLVAGLTFKPAVACYTTLSAPFASFVYNGGQQITISLAATPIDGYTLQLNDRVLVNCAGTQAANGVYLVTQLASPITLVRPADLDGSPLSEFQQGGLFYVTNGTVFGGSLFVQSSASPSIIGTSPIVYSQYAAAKNITAGTNIAITGNSVAVAPALSGITGVGLSASDGSTGVLTVSKASGADSYALALPSAAPASNTFLKYDGANYSWSAAGSPLTGGTNINITSNAVGLNASVSGLTSVGINGTSAADALILSKASGGAAYTLALPAAAPAANTYLNYTGSSYVWGAASGGSSSALVPFTGASSGSAGTAGGVPAPPAGQQNSYLQANGTWSPVMGTGAVAAGSGILQKVTYEKSIGYSTTLNTWIDVPNLSITVTPNSTTSTFLLTANITFTIAAGNTVAFRFMRGSTEIGIGTGGSHQGSFRASPDTSNYNGWAAKAIGNYLDAPNTTSSITYKVQFMGPTGFTVYFNNANTSGVDNTCCISTLTSQEVTNNNNIISPFTGATSTTDGIVGYIPAPPAGTQNSYLRGDGKWIQANNAPTATQYLFALNIISNSVITQGQPIAFATLKHQSGGGAISYTSPYLNFTLQSGYTYKLCSGCNNANNTSIFSWYNVSTSEYIGVYGDANGGTANGPAIAYISPSSITLVGVYGVSGSGSSIGGLLAMWMTIEVVSNNNTIIPFIGASNSTNGLLGYIPAPLSGQQNSYLRGDGTWQQANNAPTAAEYMHVTNVQFQVQLNKPFEFATTLLSIGASIAHPTSTQFVLRPGCTYKCTASIGSCTNSATGVGTYVSWSTSNTGTVGYFGNIGAINTAYYMWQAVGYISPSVVTTIYLMVDSINQAPVNMHVSSSWATIEVVSNNNTITAFTGATSALDGTLGYLPAPKAGQQNSYLCGNGTWQSATAGPFATQYLFARASGQSISANTFTYLLFPLTDTVTASGTTAIIQNNTTQFTILPGYSYKITGILNSALVGNDYQITTGIYINDIKTGQGGVGSPTSNTAAWVSNTTSVCYTSPTSSSTVKFGFTGGNGSSQTGGAILTIEVVANNNNITAFSGATATNDGIVGYIPAPKAGNQNMFLRGDGSWQNATIANYYMAYATAVARNGAITFGSVPVNIGTAITTTDNKAYTLASGFTYKITVMLTVNSYSDYNSVKLMNNGVQFGTTTYGNSNAGVFQYTNVGYILATTSASTFTTNYYSQSNAADTPLGFFAGITACSCLIIEVVSGNNAITAFKGATADTDGIVGYIPPPKAGSQNMFLRGDGQWQNATAAIYYYAALTSNPVANTNMVFNTDVLNIGTAITTTNGSSFTLAAGYTYKIYAGAINNTTIDGSLKRANINLYNNGVVFGSGGEAYSNNSNTSIPCYAFGYLSATTTAATLTVRALNTNTSLPGYITIEVVSGNNAITAFKGATTNTDGGVGYIPAPLAGTQNSYLRGDGTWQQANNAPTSAIYLFALNTTDGYVTIMGTPIPFPVIRQQSGISGVVSYSTSFSNFTLQPGYTYKLSAGCNYATTPGSFQWATNISSVVEYIGVAGDTYQYAGGPAIAYISPSVATIVGVYAVQGGLTAKVYVGLSFWMTIEVVSNNNTISAFTGATATTNGIVGYIPAPPAGTQNSYLRGDGTWQQANNAPTAAEYYMTTQPENKNATYNTLFEFSTTPVMSAGSAIKQISTTQFQLAAGYTYKLTAALNQPLAILEATCQWSTSTTLSGVIGVAGDAGNSNQNQSAFAIAYLSPTVVTTVGVVVTYANGISAGNSIVITGLAQGRQSFVTIEVVSNNNTITQFTGCTAYQNGSIGYIPAPALGDQTKFLCANGTWSPSVTAGTDVSVAGSTVSLSATLNSVTTLNNVAKLTGLSAPVSGPDAANKTYVDAQDALKLSLTGGTMSGALNMGTQAISNAASLAINGTSAADALTLSKATGGAAYTLALPAAAPIANTYLGYNGTNYTWNANGAAIAFKSRMSTSASNYPIINRPLIFDAVDANIGSCYNNATGIFTASVAGVYQFNAAVTNGTDNTYTYFYIVKNGGNVSLFDTNTSNMICNTYAKSNVSSTMCGIASLVVGDTVYVCCTLLGGPYKVNDSFSGMLVSSNNSNILPFTGATSVADGAIGYIPKPIAGQNKYVLTGAGGWTPISALYTVVTLTSGTSWTAPNISSINVLVVGGGGGGCPGPSAWTLYGGGGGAGGSCVLSNNYSITPLGTITYSIGAGGSYNNNGINTTFGSITAQGGKQSGIGAMGGYNVANTTYTYGGVGVTPGGSGNEAGGGGAGYTSGGNGINNIKAGRGGDGITIMINGVNYSYGGGGGGGGSANGAGEYGGRGGGGNGSSPGYTGPIVGGATAGTNGTANTGGGGGGAGGNSAGGAGGSGVILIWY